MSTSACCMSPTNKLVKSFGNIEFLKQGASLPCPLANPKADTEATHQVMMCLCRSCVRCLVCWWILDVMAIGLRNQQPTQKRTQERQPKKSNVYTKTDPVYKKILLSNTDHRHIQYPPPPNSGHMSDTLNTSKIIDCCLLFQPREVTFL